MTEFGPLLRVSQGGNRGVGWTGIPSQAHAVVGRSHFCAAENSQQLASSGPARECLSPLDPLPRARLIRSGPPWIISILMNSKQMDQGPQLQQQNPFSFSMFYWLEASPGPTHVQGERIK